MIGSLFFHAHNKISLPQFIYAAGSGQYILKIDPVAKKSGVLFKDEKNSTWNGEGLVYLPNNKLILSGHYDDGYYGAMLLDINLKSNIKKMYINNPLFFPKHNTFIFLKSSGVYLSSDIYNLTNARRLAGIYDKGLPYFIKMTEDKFAFWGLGENNEKKFFVYHFPTNEIKNMPYLDKQIVDIVYRSKTNEFFISECDETDCKLFMTDGNGSKKSGPKCISLLSKFNELLYYDKKLDQVYFNSTYVRFHPQNGAYEDKDLYVYDFETDQCVKIYESLYVTNVITSSEIEAIDKTKQSIQNSNEHSSSNRSKSYNRIID
ncbi:MAG: hypothetical protein HQM16_14630 [Deltaproteobacteria bacterium]|nr:hypothetical protein [Deltaproteobacteria bacterium]